MPARVTDRSCWLPTGLLRLPTTYGSNPPLLWCRGSKNKSRHGLYLHPVFTRPDRRISLRSARRGSDVAARKRPAGDKAHGGKANLSKVLPATFRKITGTISSRINTLMSLRSSESVSVRRRRRQEGLGAVVGVEMDLKLAVAG